MSTNLLNLYMDIDRARNAFKRAIEETYPIGSPVSWLGAINVITGVVISHDYDDSMQVLNPKTNKTYRIYFYQIVPAEADSSLLYMSCQVKVAAIHESLRVINTEDATSE